MDISKPAADVRYTTKPEQSVHPNIARALTTGKHAKANRLLLEALRRLVSPGTAADKYVIVEQIGSGMSATVHQGKALRGGQLVAIKRIKLCHQHETDPYISRFHCEVYYMKTLCSDPSLKHNLPLYLDSYLVADELWLVMEYIQGVCLFPAAFCFPLTPEEVATIFYHVLKAVEYLHHHGVMHNDIKMDNVMLGANGEVKLIDLGLSRPITDCMKSANVAVRISAPELLKGEEYDCRTDIWAVGIILYQVLFRQSPFGKERDDKKFKEQMLAHGKPPIPDGKKLDPDMADFLDQCLTVNRHERPSATHLLRHKVFSDVKVHSTAAVSRLVIKSTGRAKP
jgi:serine/threonine protein kinase